MKLFVHCGLHKTGSTALQTALSHMSDDLSARGVAFPSYEPGNAFAHHWMAGALKGPRAYRHAEDNISRMIETVQATDAHTVCFSSEDFETHLTHANAMARLTKIADRLHAQPVYLIYLRNQVEYFESLYLQFLRMGLHQGATEVIDQVLETGQFKWRKWVIQFDYAQMLDALAQVKGDTVVRSYHTLTNGCIIEDFLTCIGQPAHLKPDAQATRANSARLKRNLHRFAANTDRRVDAELVQQADKQMEGLRPRLSIGARTQLKERFWEGNAAIEAQYGIELNKSFERAASSAPVPVIDTVFETSAIDALAAHNATHAFELPTGWLAQV